MMVGTAGHPTVHHQAGCRTTWKKLIGRTLAVSKVKMGTLPSILFPEDHNLHAGRKVKAPPRVKMGTS